MSEIDFKVVHDAVSAIILRTMVASGRASDSVSDDGLDLMMDVALTALVMFAEQLSE